MAATTFLSLSMLAMTIVNASPVKVVREAPGKRGLAFNNDAYLSKFPIDQPKFSWCYNWGPFFDPPQGLEFVPLLHGNQEEFTKNWFGNLEKSVAGGSKEVFSFNEPDQCGGGGSCMQNVGVAAQAYRDLIQSPIQSNKKLEHVRMGAPSVTNGDAPKGKDYLQRFLGACSGCHFDFLNAHWYASATKNQYYDPVQKFINQTTEIHNLKPEVPLWITEWGFDAGTDAEKKSAMEDIMQWMDKQDWIERYAYHMVAPEILLNSAGNGLSVLGNAYVSA